MLAARRVQVAQQADDAVCERGLVAADAQVAHVIGIDGADDGLERVDFDALDAARDGLRRTTVSTGPKCTSRRAGRLPNEQKEGLPRDRSSLEVQT